MNDTKPAPQLLEYATPAPAPTRQSGYAVASLVVAGASLLWLALEMKGGSLPFEVEKQHRIGSIMSVLAIILAFAGYRHRRRKRALKHIAMGASGWMLVLYMLTTM